MRTCPQCERTYPDDINTCPLDQTPLPKPVKATDAELAGSLTRKYRIIRRLGEGGMGTVFLAEQIAVGNRPVALKVLLRKLLDDPEFLLRFRNEAGSTGRIRHPNVVTIYESGQADDGTPYIAMEYLEGETLSDTLKRRGALPVPECTEIVWQAGRGLHAAHKLGIIHRDLKPDNIFLTRGDEGELTVKVVDFGIAKLLDASNLTITGMVLGTPAYMSSEHAAGMRGDQLDARADIYSLGIVAYEMLTGRVPFHSETPLGLVHKHVLELPPSFQAVRADLRLPKQLERVIMRALEKDREKRYPTAIEFCREFAEAAQASPPADRPAGIPPTAEAPPRPPVQAARGPSAPAPPAQGTSAAVKTPPSWPVPAEPLPRRKETATPARPYPPRVPVVATPARLERKSALSPLTAVLIAAGLLLVTIAGFLWRHSEKLPPGMVYIPGGTFMMGCERDQDPTGSPQHYVTVAGFYLDQTPVTNAQYLEFVRATGYAAPSGWAQGKFPANQENWPVTGVAWAGAAAYAKWKGKRLPTEAEWEFAARGMDGRIYPWGNNFNLELTNSAERPLGHPEAVGSHPQAASPFGVLDMSGNVWQWCLDDYKLYPGSRTALQIPPGAKVIRGGSFESDRNHVTTVTRNLDVTTSQSPRIGFRCARSP
jgi:eukaryotic-like serine/threonine-protein kinase